MLFAKADRKNCMSISKVLEVFCDVSRQNVNNQKSRVYFSSKVFEDSHSEYYDMLGFHSTPNLGKYLSFPLKQLGASTQDFDFIIERIKAKLAGWKGQLLSFAGRVVLTKFMLSTIPLYAMQSHLLPRRVLDSLDRVSRNFIWGTTQE